MTETRSWVLWGRGFRPFFLLAGAQAVFAVGVWLAVLQGIMAAPGWSTPFQWHAHEMIFGFAGAAIAGFLLTSVPAWTGCRPLAGPGLMGLALLWLAGRLAIYFAPLLPSPWLVALVDLSFFAVLAGVITPPIFVSRRYHNFVFPLLLLVLLIAGALTHAGAIGIWPGAGQTGGRLGVGAVILIISVLGGRLVPLFTGAALARADVDAEISRSAWADATAAPVLAVFVLLDTLMPDTPQSGAVALFAAGILAVRMKGWGLGQSLRDPLLWSMHIAYLWLPVGLATLGVSAFSVTLSRNIGVHALTLGAIGGMILAIMSRVALGHTGRSFQAPRGLGVAYVLVLAAAVIRTLLVSWLPTRMGELLLASGLLWLAAFTIFLVVYVPVLIGPRVDGKPS